MGKRTKKPRVRLYEPPKVEHVMMLGPPEKDCAVACLAMMAGTTYTEAWLYALSVAPNVERRGMSCPALLEALEDMTEEQYRLRRLPYPRPSMAHFADWPNEPCIVIIRADMDKQGGHFIVWEPRGRWIHDPEGHKRYRLSEYTEGMDERLRVIGFIERIDNGPDDAA